MSPTKPTAAMHTYKQNDRKKRNDTSLPFSLQDSLAEFTNATAQQELKGSPVLYKDNAQN